MRKGWLFEILVYTQHPLNNTIAIWLVTVRGVTPNGKIIGTQRHIMLHWPEEQRLRLRAVHSRRNDHRPRSQTLDSWKTSSGGPHKWVGVRADSLEERSGESLAFEQVIDVGVQDFAIPVVSHMATIVHTCNLDVHIFKQPIQERPTSAQVPLLPLPHTHTLNFVTMTYIPKHAGQLDQLANAMHIFIMLVNHF